MNSVKYMPISELQKRAVSMVRTDQKAALDELVDRGGITASDDELQAAFLAAKYQGTILQDDVLRDIILAVKAQAKPLEKIV